LQGIVLSPIGVKRYRTAYAFSYRIFIYLEIMFAAFGLRYINDVQAVPLNDDRGLQRMPFFPE
jgi:hypothetical protein